MAVHLVYFSCFDMLYQEKSGNPAPNNEHILKYNKPMGVSHKVQFQTSDGKLLEM
jgi:hypothetical protein